METLLMLAAIYVGLGILFGLFFAFRGVGRFDPVAKGAPWGFRLLILPGASALWPFLIARTLRGGEDSE